MRADYDAANNTANEILLKAKSIKGFPFSIKEVVKEFSEIEFTTYSELEALGGNASMIIGSNDGALLESCGRHILFYNDRMPSERIAFTFAHELGHLELHHDMKTLTELREAHDELFAPLYEKYEKEASVFAAQLVMPVQVVRELAKRGCKITTAFLSEHFGVSNQCAQVRISNLGYQKKSEYDDLILGKFKGFIDRVAKRTSSFSDEYEREFEMERIRQSW